MIYNLSWLTNEDCPRFTSVKYDSLFWAVVMFFRLRRAKCKKVSLSIYRGPRKEVTV